MPIDSSHDLQQPAPMPTRHQIAAQNRAKPNKVTGRLKQALDAMAWEGKTDNEASVNANLHVFTVRQALRKPHVREYLRGQMDLLRAREHPRNIHRLCEIRDAADNMPAVNAIKILEQLDDEQRSRSGVAGHQSPGFSIEINVINGPTANDSNAQVIEHEPSGNTGS